MTEEMRDPELSRRYRALSAEEPPHALDEAILAVSRRGAGARPASLDRASRQRWYGPLAAAAVILLAVAVTLHLEFEQPEVERAAPSAPKPAQPAAPVPETAPAQAAADAAAKAAPEPVKPKAETLAKRTDPRAFVPDPVPPAAPAPVPAPQLDAPVEAPAAAAGRARPLAAVKSFSSRSEAQRATLAGAPERELEPIIELRRNGRHDEADKALAEFRKRYPDYKIPQPMLERLERR